MSSFLQYIQTKVHPKYKRVCEYNRDAHCYLNTVHDYSIKERRDLTHVESYSVDPATCTDVDDAFSVWFDDDGKMKLAIHIADPTYYFSPQCEIFSAIQRNAFTHYPSNRTPIHMMPREILNHANLMVDGNGVSQMKNAMSVIFTIDKETLLPVDYDVCASMITVKVVNKLSYEVDYDENHDPAWGGIDSVEKLREDAIYYGLLISRALRVERNSAVEKMVEYNRTSFVYDANGAPRFTNATNKAMELKKMIEEFAILTNDAVGAYLHRNDSSYGFYRSCVVDTDALCELVEEESSESILKFIITNGIQAYYNEKSGAHDLVSKSHYTHFTSPLRRFTDCITHFILKSIMLGKEAPFTVSELKLHSDYSNKFGKSERNIQFEDKKVNTLWALHGLLQSVGSGGGDVYIRVKFMGYVKNFLNFMIYNVVVREKNSGDGVGDSGETIYYTHISYCARMFDYKYLDFWNKKDSVDVKVNEVHCITRFDMGILPDLERVVANPNSIM